MHDNYKPLTLQPDQEPIERCPLCGSKASLWQYSEDETSPVSRVVMCDNGDDIGPEDGAIVGGCLLYMPPQRFYMPLGRQAIRWWNEYSTALVGQRMTRAFE